MTDTPTTAATAPQTVEIAQPRINSGLNLKPDTFPAMDMAVPEAMRAMAERSVTQTRDGYEKAKVSLEASVEVLERSLDMAGKGAAELNRKVIDFAQANLNSSFEFARGIASARNFAEVLELQGIYFREQFQTLTAQSKDVRDLSSRLASEAAEPLKSHVATAMDKLKLN